MPGGVCAVLDYEVEMMADYVSEMATRIVMPRNSVNVAFRKFVSQILTSTRLPSTTILLGMNYLAKRVNMMHAEGQNNHSEGQIWRMLTIALLLGSKFLDDNTFQNKSWSEVSGISVQELNTLEYEWLRAISWCLYVNLDESKDYNAWLANWKQWLDNKKRQQAQASRERLAVLVPPTETELARSRNPQGYSTWHQQQVAEYERLSSMKRNQVPTPSYRRGDQTQNSWGYPMAWPTSAPLTPPDSGYGTPEYSNSATSVNTQYTEWFDRAIVSNGSTSRQFQQPATYNTFQHAGHQSRNPYGAFYNYGHNIWEHPGVADCNCANCVAAQNKAPYFAGHTYGQPVVG
ncbi:hypothetical protein B0T26DRAFT_199000 [Lasiosphaeria miniovina]|uniref:Cyclin-like protein n=1 Tax=Lasiosphaeria miniovina TaxID=1954250 RepID=A0AA40E1Z2_9PEZI|nr:uncharacterized protein B0T26DRAFT_199000 [Lasiosphaeria miniovina]KAK0722017.1 hypothetical protein B0T26DRAFT_199000 [Lasiosphaeria miniovina]